MDPESPAAVKGSATDRARFAGARITVPSACAFTQDEKGERQ
jgi:hypothetical protein